jgi:Ca2+-binding EF-hand superfamily protein
MKPLPKGEAGFYSESKKSYAMEVKPLVFTTAGAKPPQLLKKGHLALGDAALLKHQDMLSAFRSCDSDGDHNVDAIELKHALHMEGVDLEQSDLELLMGMYDTSHDGKISYKEFMLALGAEMKLEYDSSLLQGKQSSRSEQMKSPKNRRQRLGGDSYDLVEKLGARITDSGEEMRKKFNKYDPSGSGKVSQSTFADVLKGGYGIDTKSMQLRGLYDSLDDGTGCIAYNIFIKSLIDGTKVDSGHLKQAKNQLGNASTNRHKGLRQAFKAADKDNSNFLDINELDDAVAQSGTTLTEHELHVLMQMYDKSNDGKVDSNEFINAIDGIARSKAGNAGDADSALRKRMKDHAHFASLDAAFKHADTDNSGFLSMAELKAAVEDSGVELKQEQLELLLDIYDKSHDGKISCNEFMEAMRGLVEPINPNRKVEKKTAKKHKYTQKQLLHLVRTKMEGAAQGGGGQARKMFKKFDRDGSGTITKAEFKDYMKLMGIELEDDEFDSFFDTLDEDASKEIKYNEFIKNIFDSGSTTIDVGTSQGEAEKAEETLKNKLVTNFANFRQAFISMDEDRDQKLSLTELRSAINHAGIRLKGSELKRLMELLSGGEGDFATFEQFASRMGVNKDKLSGQQVTPGQELGGGAMAKYALGAHKDQTNGKFGKSAEMDHGKGAQKFLGPPPNFRYSYPTLIRQLRKEFETNTKSKADIFAAMDHDGSGMLERSEFADLMRMMGYNLTNDDVKEFFSHLDSDGSGAIDYEEFLHHVTNKNQTASLENLGKGTAEEADKAFRQKIYEKYRNLTSAFRSLDKDKDNYLDIKELRYAIDTAGVSLSQKELKKLMKQYDVHETGKINFEDFEKVMKSDFCSDDHDGLSTLLATHGQHGMGVHNLTDKERFKVSSCFSWRLE